jgi:hypothetical protein
MVTVLRRGSCTVDGIAQSIGLRSHHVELVISSLLARELLVQRRGGVEIAADHQAEVTAIGAVYDRYRHRLIEAVTSVDG